MSTAERIRELEDAFDRQLPKRRLTGPLSADLLAAARRWSEAVWSAAEEAGPPSLSREQRDRGLRLGPHPVFICGAHRSGTTLVRDLLDSHPALAVLPSEGSYLTELRPKMKRLPQGEKLPFLGREWLRRLANPVNQAPFFLLGRSSKDVSPYVGFARSLMTWWSAVQGRGSRNDSLRPLLAVALAYASCSGQRGIGEGVERWVEKTPTNERFSNRLWTEFPEAKIVHVVRDPVAVFASRKRIERTTGSSANPRRMLSDLARSYKIAARHASRDHGKAFVIRYEDLVAEPEKAVGRLAEFLEIEPSPVLLEPSVAGKPSRSNSSFHDSDREGLILPSTESLHRESLSGEELELLAAFTAESAQALGYRIALPGAWRTLLLRTRLRLRRS